MTFSDSDKFSVSEAKLFIRISWLKWFRYLSEPTEVGAGSILAWPRMLSKTKTYLLHLQRDSFLKCCKRTQLSDFRIYEYFLDNCCDLRCNQLGRQIEELFVYPCQSLVGFRSWNMRSFLSFKKLLNNFYLALIGMAIPGTHGELWTKV